MTEELIKYKRKKRVIYSRRISFTCTPELGKLLDKKARTQNRTVSIVVRMILEGLYSKVVGK